MYKYNDMFHLTDLSLKFVGIFGIFAEDKSKYRWSYYMFFLGTFNLFWLMSMEFAQLIDLLTNEFTLSDFQVLGQVCACFIESCFSTMTTLLVYYHREKIMYISDELRRMWPVDGEGIVAEDIIREAMLPTRRVCMGYSVVMNSCSGTFFLMPVGIFFHSLFFTDDTKLPFPFYMKYPFNPRANHILCFLCFVSQVHGGILTSTGASATECSFSILVSNICMHFRMIGNEIENIDPNEKDDAARIKKIKDINIYFRKLVEMTNDIGHIYAPSILAKMVGGSALMCMTLFSILICSLEKIPENLLFFASVTIQIFVMSWYGSRLTHEAENIASAAYNSQWIGSNKHHIFAVKMFQVIATRPVAISVMGFFDLSLASFTSILSAAMSYFTLLRQLMDEHD